MANPDKAPSRHIVWQMNIPETALDLYFNHVRMLPSWKLNFPDYVHPAIRDAVEVAPNETKIITETGEYVFAFHERSTFVLEAAEFVKTGILEVYYNTALVLRLTISPPDSAGLVKSSWVSRGVEEFIDGEWVGDLTRLGSRLAAYETEQTKKEKARRQDELMGIVELKDKLSRIPPGETEKPSLFRWLFRHSGM
jgi:hypothetical protein